MSGRIVCQIILVPNGLDKLTSNKRNVNVHKENYPPDIMMTFI